MNNVGWQPADGACPKCGDRTEIYTVEEYDEYTESTVLYETAERCPRCGWVIEFDE